MLLFLVSDSITEIIPTEISFIFFFQYNKIWVVYFLPETQVSFKESPSEVSQAKWLLLLDHPDCQNRLNMQP